jgi:cysteine-S-conjugate beta-lyase
MNFDFDKIIDRSNTNSWKWEKYPKEVLPFWIADMDFESPIQIKDALKKSIDSGVYGYNQTFPELVDVFIERLKHRHKLKVELEAIVLLPGMVPALYATANMFKGGIVTNTPVYRPFIESSLQASSNSKFIPFIEKNNRWEMDFDKMESIIDPDDKVFMLCNPHNPNGRVFTKKELLKLGEICKKHDLIICSDEIHCDLILDNTKEHISIASLNTDLENRTITLLAPSKTFNIAGLGCTFAVIPNKELRDQFKKTIYGIIPHPSGLSMEAALAAYKFGETWRLSLIDYLKNNHDYLQAEINSINGLSMKNCEATYLAWINFEDLNRSDFVMELEKHGVGVQDAKIFGGENYFRFNFGTQKSRINEGIKRIKSALMF